MQPSTSRITIVRMNVAKSEFTSSTPTFAKIAVNAANVAESSAQNCHESVRDFIPLSAPVLFGVELGYFARPSAVARCFRSTGKVCFANATTGAGSLLDASALNLAMSLW